MPVSVWRVSTWTPRLVALDVDGTLLDATGVISRPVRAAVARAAQRAHVVIATGRTVLGTIAVLEALGLRTGTAVCSNGAVRVDAATGTATALAVFDPAPALRVLDEHVPGARYAVEHLGSGHRLSAPFPPGALSGAAEVVPRAALVEGTTTRAIAWWPELDTTTAEHVLDGVDLPGATATLDMQGFAWLTLVAEGVSKASALAVVCAGLGVDASDVLAVGDGTNDTEMLAWAGRGVAMGQALEVVRSAADAVTGTIAADGAAAELDRWF